MIDARGRSCPEPVIMTRKAVMAGEKAGEKHFEVLVDSRVCVENVTRYAEHSGYTVNVSDTEDGFKLCLDRI